MNAIAMSEIATKPVGIWVRPSQCSSLRQWVHRSWVHNCYWDGSDCLVFVLRRRWFGFELEFIERKYVPDELI